MMNCRRSNSGFVSISLRCWRSVFCFFGPRVSGAVFCYRDIITVFSTVCREVERARDVLRSSYLMFNEDVVSALLICGERFALEQIVKIWGYCVVFLLNMFLFYVTWSFLSFVLHAIVFCLLFFFCLFLKDLKVIEPTCINITCVQLQISLSLFFHSPKKHWGVCVICDLTERCGDQIVNIRIKQQLKGRGWWWWWRLWGFPYIVCLIVDRPTLKLCGFP